eukprot:TRINITY_DN7166_c0_g1_i1.p1 TRINITY_DN7166_c0_g1~~TRINITY_DN7166_c0_g1_i1.p1  ORF type:complete len:1111 (+),score=310.83 TRINITY_DN7166_c0_g1_i1:76-3333(+)
MPARGECCGYDRRDTVGWCTQFWHQKALVPVIGTLVAAMASLGVWIAAIALHRDLEVQTAQDRLEARVSATAAWIQTNCRASSAVLDAAAGVDALVIITEQGETAGRGGKEGRVEQAVALAQQVKALHCGAGPCAWGAVPPMQRVVLLGQPYWLAAARANSSLVLCAAKDDRAAGLLANNDFRNRLAPIAAGIFGFCTILSFIINFACIRRSTVRTANAVRSQAFRLAQLCDPAMAIPEDRGLPSDASPPPECCALQVAQCALSRELSLHDSLSGVEVTAVAGGGAAEAAGFERGMRLLRIAGHPVRRRTDVTRVLAQLAGAAAAAAGAGHPADVPPQVEVEAAPPSPRFAARCRQLGVAGRCHRLEWLRSVVRGLWHTPELQIFLHDLVCAEIKEAIQLSGGRLARQLHSVAASPGQWAAPHLECVQVDSPLPGDPDFPAATGGVQLTVGIEWETPLPLSLEFRVGSVGVTHVSLSGVLIIDARGACNKPPFLAGLSIGFLNVPELKVSFSGAATLANCTEGVRNRLDSLVARRFGEHLVVPNFISVPLDLAFNVARWLRPPPLGLLRLRLLSARRLKGLSWRPGLTWVSHPFLVARVGASFHRFPTKRSTCNPQWTDDNEAFFPVYSWEQEVRLLLFHEGTLGNLGLGSVFPPPTVRAVCDKEAEHPVGSGGSLRVRAQLVQFAEGPTEGVPPVAVTVDVGSARDLRQASSDALGTRPVDPSRAPFRVRVTLPLGHDRPLQVYTRVGAPQKVDGANRARRALAKDAAALLAQGLGPGQVAELLDIPDELVQRLAGARWRPDPRPLAPAAPARPIGGRGRARALSHVPVQLGEAPHSPVIGGLDAGAEVWVESVSTYGGGPSGWRARVTRCCLACAGRVAAARQGVPGCAWHYDCAAIAGWASVAAATGEVLLAASRDPSADEELRRERLEWTAAAAAARRARRAVRNPHWRQVQHRRIPLLRGGPCRARFEVIDRSGDTVSAVEVQADAAAPTAAGPLQLKLPSGAAGGELAAHLQLHWAADGDLDMLECDGATTAAQGFESCIGDEDVLEWQSPWHMSRNVTFGGDMEQATNGSDGSERAPY